MRGFNGVTAQDGTPTANSCWGGSFPSSILISSVTPAARMRRMGALPPWAGDTVVAPCGHCTPCASLGCKVGGDTGTRAALAFVCPCQTDANKPEFDFQDRLGNIAN